MERKWLCSGERGFVSLLGVCMLLLIMFLGAGAFSLSQGEYQTEQRALLGLQLRLEAESGVETGMVRLQQDALLLRQVLGSSGQDQSVWSGIHDGIRCDVYAVYKAQDAKLLMMAVTSKGEQRGRAVACLKKRGEKYILDYWEH